MQRARDEQGGLHWENCSDSGGATQSLTTSEEERKSAMEALEALEEKEQILIQHIRTCGLRQAKESSLVDEVMAIRRERRKLFSAFQERCSSLVMQLEERAQELQAAKRSMSADLADAVSRYEEEISAQKEKLQLLEQLLREERIAQSERAKIIEQTSVGQMKLAYEAKLQSLEEKLREIVTEKQTAELTQARTLANSIVKKVTKSIEENYQRKLTEYASYRSLCLLEFPFSARVRTAVRGVSGAPFTYSCFSSLCKC